MNVNVYHFQVFTNFRSPLRLFVQDTTGVIRTNPNLFLCTNVVLTNRALRYGVLVLKLRHMVCKS